MSDAIEGQSLRPSDRDLNMREDMVVEFQDLLKTSFHPQEIESWVTQAAVRQDLFADLVVGRVRWSKRLGRPDVPQLLSGFVFDSQFWVDIWHIGLDGSIVTDKNGWVRGDVPSVWDGPTEPDHYSVKYMFYAADQNDNQLEVRFSDAHWRREGPASRRHPRLFLTPPGYIFHNAGRFTALEDITIDIRPSVTL